jgi:hypothetical protein
MIRAKYLHVFPVTGGTYVLRFRQAVARLGRYFRICHVLLLATAAWAQGGFAFLSAGFPAVQKDRTLLRSPDMPRLSLPLPTARLR